MNATADAPLRLKRLRVNEFAGRRMDVDLEFADGLNVLLGENGGGKTTLLNLIVALVRGEPDFLRHHGVDAEVWLSGAAEFRYHLKVEARRAHRPVDAAPATWSIDGETTWEGRTWGWAWGSDTARRGAGLWPDGAATPEPMRVPPAAISVANTGAMTDTLLGCRVGRFDEAVDCFRTLVGETEPRDLAPVTHATRLPDVGPDPLMAWPLPLVEPDLRNERWRSGTVPWLSRLARELRASELIVQPTNLRAEAGSVTARSVSLQVVWPDGSEGPAETELSFGQKRLFALLWHLHASPLSPLMADELTNGFHHSWLEFVLRELASRQAIVAVQNPLLLDHLTFGSAADVRRAVTLCRPLPVDAGRAWAWEKPTHAQAEHLYAAWSRGMTLVSELLRREGLW